MEEAKHKIVADKVAGEIVQEDGLGREEEETHQPTIGADDRDIDQEIEDAWAAVERLEGGGGTETKDKDVDIADLEDIDITWHVAACRPDKETFI